jgi:hypothetical protein
LQVQYLLLIVASSWCLHLLTIQDRANGAVSLDVRGVVEDVDTLTLGFDDLDFEVHPLLFIINRERES